jgi:hypothetical protein
VVEDDAEGSGDAVKPMKDESSPYPALLLWAVDDEAADDNEP